MSGRPPLPRSQSLLAVAVVALVATAGCSSGLGGLGGSGGGSGGAQLDSVPADAEMVGHVDVSGMLSDDSLRSIVNTVFEVQANQSEYYSGPESISDALEQMENDSGLDPTKVEGVTFFGTSTETSLSSASGAGMIVTSSYTESELVDAMKEGSDNWSEDEYRGTTMYTYGFEGQNAVAVLGDGTFAFGDRAAVESVVDVRAGNAEQLGGKLKTTFQNTDSGYVRLAMAVPQDEVPTERYNAGTEMNLTAFNTVQYVSMSFATSGDEVTTKLNMVTESSSDAERTYEVIDGALSIYSGVGNEEVQETLKNLSVSKNGDTVTVTYADTVESIEESLRKLYATTSGTASASTSGSGSASESGSASGSSETRSTTAEA